MKLPALEKEPAATKYKIPHKYLHPEVQAEIAKLHSMRKLRLAQAISFSPMTGYAIPIASKVYVPLLSSYLHNLDSPLIMVGAALTGSPVGYAIGSGPVAEQTRKVGEAVSKHGFLAENVPHRFEKLVTLIQMKKTHPAFYVDTFKNIVLVPRTRWESIAQKTSIGRKRVTY